MTRSLLALAIIGALASCSSDPKGGDSPEALAQVWKNLAPIDNPNPDPAPQPRRYHPYDVALAGDLALVALRGSELEPASQIVIVKVDDGVVVARLQVGARPVAVRVHPAGRFAVVLSQLSPLASVVDLALLAVTETFEVGYYAQDLVFSADGRHMWITQRTDDELQRWSVASNGAKLRPVREVVAPSGRVPNAVTLDPTGTKIYVADDGALGLRVHDATSLTELGYIGFNAPIFDVEPMGSQLVVTTLNDTNGLPCSEDADFAGIQGDGIYGLVTDRTCGRGFADIQNEIAFVDPASDVITWRFTSDSAELSEADREGDHSPDLMRVRGSQPQQIEVVDESRAWITMGTSFELVELMLIDGDPMTMTMPRSFTTGFAPRGLTVSESGSTAVVANKLGDSLTIIDLDAGQTRTVVVGSANPPFPATSAEIGELFFHSAAYATDGDQSCTHCHPDNGTDGKPWGVPVVADFGRRATLPMRNLFATAPLLVEGVLAAGDFALEMESISFRPDFHDSSYTKQVERRDAFYRETSLSLFGQPVGFAEMVKHVESFLLVEPRLLPSPFDDQTAEVERGRALFERPDVACAACHPAPTFASDQVMSGITTLGRYDAPNYDLEPDVSTKFLEHAENGFFNVNSLRGLWDRPGVLLHDGRARTIREVILTPGHPCLQDTERGFNEFDDQVDTNGGISHLTCSQIDDLVAFLLTID